MNPYIHVCRVDMLDRGGGASNLVNIISRPPPHLPSKKKPSLGCAKAIVARNISATRQKGSPRSGSWSQKKKKRHREKHPGDERMRVFALLIPLR